MRKYLLRIFFPTKDSNKSLTIPLLTCDTKIKIQYQNGRYETNPFISYFTPNHFHSGSLGMWSLWSENQQGQLKFRIVEEGEI